MTIPDRSGDAWMPHHMVEAFLVQASMKKERLLKSML